MESKMETPAEASKELISVSNVNCPGVGVNPGPMTRFEKRQGVLTVPALIHSFRDGTTEVFCPSLRENSICGVRGNGGKRDKCHYIKGNC